MRPFLSKTGIDTQRVVIRDGSGYAHSNLISPSDLIAILKYIRYHKEWKIFRESLPIAGIDGTLNYRMKDSEAAGNVRAKTGYIEHARTISGFVTTADGDELVFSILCNHFTVDKLEIEKVQDAILIKLAQYSRY
jgi:D-alanyl-D-alanine carboxypeptidase/D-alanyl-D-alanine-endopeptidase (penicillin-binding protein 4)